MIAVLAVHAVVAALAGVTGHWLGRRVFWLCTLGPLSTLALVAACAGRALDGRPVHEHRSWVPGLGLELSFRVDAFALVMLALVGGIGVLVMAYASQYFHHQPGLARFAALLSAFAGAMTGLVAADDLLLVFVFWELTSVTSYGLIGFDDRSAPARSAATHALLITGAGGLALLAGVILLRLATGAASISALEEVAVSGELASVAAVLVLIGCFTKSAQVPFHGWLPGAMAAPTPVSAFLHSATMVKAGVVLVARLSPHLAHLPPWQPLTVGVGLATMAWGGYRALRQDDLKLVLAYGTVSQLGMLVAVFGTGEPKLLLAGTALLVAHAVYKASLFMVVGIVDHATHTRRLSRLSGVGRAAPGVAAVAATGAASMAGVAPLFGFVAKEAAIEGLLDATFAARVAATAAFVAASALTAAYTLRFLWGAFADRPGISCRIDPPPALLVAPAAVLVVPTITLGVFAASANRLLRPAAAALDAGAANHELVLWHGASLALGLSILALVIGGTLFVLRGPVEAFQDRVGRRWTAAEVFQQGLYATLVVARRATAVIQTGSLPLYLALITLAAFAVPAVAVFDDVALPDGWVWAHDPVQAVLAFATASAAIGVAVADRRLGAVVLLGVVGFGSAALFAVHGAPDLALTQILIETIAVVVYVLVLRHLPARFRRRTPTAGSWVRAGIAGGVSLVMFALVLVATGARTTPPIDDQLSALAYPEADGRNVVNVILVDFRGFDTLGEAVVLVVAALGVLAVVLAERDRPRREATHPERAGAVVSHRIGQEEERALGLGEPAVVLDVAVRLVVHTVVLYSLFLLAAGHNAPGGGFIAGLVAGAGLGLRLITGNDPVRARLPASPQLLLAAGLALAVTTALASLVLGGPLLDHAAVRIRLPGLGVVKATSALPFDAGIYLVVVGAIAALLQVFAEDREPDPVAAPSDDPALESAPECSGEPTPGSETDRLTRKERPGPSRRPDTMLGSRRTGA